MFIDLYIYIYKYFIYILYKIQGSLSMNLAKKVIYTYICIYMYIDIYIIYIFIL